MSIAIVNGKICQVCRSPRKSFTVDSSRRERQKAHTVLGILIIKYFIHSVTAECTATHTTFMRSD